MCFKINTTKYKIYKWKGSVRHLIENKQPKTILSKYEKKYDIKNNLTVFEPKYVFRALYQTDAIPLSHTAFLNIEGLKSYLKDMFGLRILSTPQKNQKNYCFCKISLGHLSIF